MDTLIVDRATNITALIDPSITYITKETADQTYLNINEKMKWMGTDGYGGLLQDVGTKRIGIAYYDKANKQMVVPTVENTLTYFEGAKFIPISDYQTAKKLENLSSVESYAIDSRLTVGVIHKIGNICILTVDSNEVYNGRNYGEVLFNIPEKFRPKFLTPVSVGIINSASGGAAHIETNGNVVWRGARTSSALYINSVYLAK